LLRIPTGGRLTSWLFTKRGGVEFGTTEDKSIQWQGAGFEQHMAICGLSLHLGTSESRKTLEQKFIFQIGTLNPIGINERFSFY